MLIQTLLIAVSVSMDTFAVSIGKGLTVKKLRGLDAFKTALWFGGFQALFPLLGYFAASTFSKYVTAVDHWIIFGLLALIGGNMVREAFEEDEENAKETADFDWKHMLPLAVACSIDAFAVGVSFAFMSLNIWISVIIIGPKKLTSFDTLSVIIIGITTGLFSAAGLYIGRAFGSRWQKPAQIAGGVVLILIGVKVLLEHLGFLA
jgi:putative Mn2+ efflux pump MntP